MSKPRKKHHYIPNQHKSSGNGWFGYNSADSFTEDQMKLKSEGIPGHERPKQGGFSSLNRRHSERNSTQAERFISARLNNRKV